jgi:hypothetical protein
MALFLYLLDQTEHDSGGRKHGREGGYTGDGAEARMEDGHTGEGGSRAHSEEQTHSYARSARVGASQQPHTLREKYGSQPCELRYGRFSSQLPSAHLHRYGTRA